MLAVSTIGDASTTIHEALQRGDSFIDVKLPDEYTKGLSELCEAGPLLNVAV